MIAAYAGSFDPITKGHENVIQRMANKFEEVHILVAINRAKNHLFSLEQRNHMVNLAVTNMSNSHKIKVIPYEGIVSDYLNKNNVDIFVRGVRNEKDRDNESTLEQFTRYTSKTETMYMFPYPEFSITSSSLVREFIKANKLYVVGNFVSGDVFHFINNYLQNPKDEV